METENPHRRPHLIWEKPGEEEEEEKEEEEKEEETEEEEKDKEEEEVLRDKKTMILLFPYEIENSMQSLQFIIAMRNKILTIPE